MKPKIIEHEQIILAGISYYGDPFGSGDAWTQENEIGRLWVRFSEYLKNHKEKIPEVKTFSRMFEVHITHDETMEKGFFEIFTGVELNKITALPPQLLLKILPRATYAVFTINGSMMNTDWEMKMHRELLPEAGLKANMGYEFQLYDERFKGVDKMDESELDVYIPVIKL